MTAADALDIARLANLRMWDAYRRADVIQAEQRRDTTLPA